MLKYNVYLAVIALVISDVNGANYIVTNVDQGPGDTLYANSSNVLLSTSSIVTIGYFNSGYDVTNNLNNYVSLITSFNILAQAAPGTYSSTLGGAFDGYVEAAEVDGAILTSGDPIGFRLYSFIGNAATLGASTQLGLVDLGQDLAADGPPTETTYLANPTGLNVLIGTTGSFSGDAGGGPGIYNTIQLQAIPEPSTFFLASLGLFAFLRRRR